MSLTLVDRQVINDMVALLYNFLPGSGNRSFSFPLAATEAHVAEFWNGTGISKTPAILALLENTLSKQRHRFPKLILSIVQQSLGWRRSKNNPLTLEEINSLNDLMLTLEIKIPELYNAQFLERLTKSTLQSKPSIKMGTDEKRASLKASLLSISSLDPQRRGFAFEKFLNECFSIFRLDPRPSFRLTGEQIDGSFQLNNETYLMEAKWQTPPIGVSELRSFSTKVQSKSQWSRGLYISYSGFSSEGLIAFSQGLAPCLICMNGQELWEVLDRKIPLSEVLMLKTRRTAETGKAFTELSSLYPNLHM